MFSEFAGIAWVARDMLILSFTRKRYITYTKNRLRYNLKWGKYIDWKLTIYFYCLRLAAEMFRLFGLVGFYGNQWNTYILENTYNLSFDFQHLISHFFWVSFRKLQCKSWDTNRPIWLTFCKAFFVRLTASCQNY